MITLTIVGIKCVISCIVMAIHGLCSVSTLVTAGYMTHRKHKGKNQQNYITQQQNIPQQTYEERLISDLQSDIMNGVEGYYILKLQGGEWVPMFRYSDATKARIVMNEYRQQFKCQMIIKRV